MPLWKVEVERTSMGYVLVEADDKEEAQEAAEELFDDNIHLDDWHDDFWPIEVDRFPEGEQYWSGGESGSWLVA